MAPLRAVLVSAIASAAIFASFGCGSGGDYGPQVSQQETVSSAQKSIKQIQDNPNLPPGLKKAQLAHLQSQIDAAQGKSGPTQAGPPPK